MGDCFALFRQFFSSPELLSTNKLTLRSLMKSFSFQMATQIEFGEGVISRIGELTAPFGKHVLLVYGKESIRKNGVYDTVAASFQKESITWAEHAGVSPNPLVTHAFEGAQIAKREQIEAIVAVGGGSVIDEAKAIALGLQVNSWGELWEYFTRLRTPEKAVPIVAVQTMPATASEVNDCTVITNPETHEKFSVRGGDARSKSGLA